jgi:Na+-driven multidrug efflux pump
VQIIFALGAASAPLYNWLFIYGCGLGLTGAAVALAAVNFSNALLMGIYIVRHNRQLAGTKEAPWLGW